MSERLTVIGLEVENFKKIRALRIVPKGALVEIRGRNAQGKSSTLDAIEAALCGRDAIPARPVRNGESKAKVKVDLGKLVVTRTIGPDGKHTLKLTSNDPEQPSTQAALDERLGQISFDPYAFVTMKPKEQAAAFRRACGIDTDALDAKRKALFDERTIVNREVARLEGAVAQAVFPDGPDDPVDVGAALRELEEANDTQSEFDDAEAGLRVIAGHIKDTETRITGLEIELEAARRARRDLVEDERKAKRWVENAKSALIDPAPIRDRIAQADATNGIVRQRQARRDLADQLSKKAGESSKLTSAIEEIDELKAAMLKAANFPIPNVRLDEDGIFLNGEPLEQASQAERLKFAVALGLALNPTIRVLLVRDGSLLDDDSLALLAQMAEDAGAQVWLERVGKEGSGFLIEDGEVVESPEEATK